MSDEERMTGGCLCGAVRFEARGNPLSVEVCHCRNCQRHTGSAFLCGVRFNIDAVSWTADKPAAYQSSAIAQRGFCSKCGSTLYICYPESPWAGLPPGISIAIGTLDDPYRWKPALHYAEENQLAWTKYDDGLPRERMDTDEELKAALERT